MRNQLKRRKSGRLRRGQKHQHSKSTRCTELGKISPLLEYQ